MIKSIKLGKYLNLLYFIFILHNEKSFQVFSLLSTYLSFDDEAYLIIRKHYWILIIFSNIFIYRDSIRILYVLCITVSISWSCFSFSLPNLALKAFVVPLPVLACLPHFILSNGCLLLQVLFVLLQQQQRVGRCHGHLHESSVGTGTFAGLRVS